MAAIGAVKLTIVIRAKDLRPGDDFETMLTKIPGSARSRLRGLGAGDGVPVELYPTGKVEIRTMLHPRVLIRLWARGQGAA